MHGETVHKIYIHMDGDHSTNQMKSFNGNTARLRKTAARGM